MSSEPGQPANWYTEILQHEGDDDEIREIRLPGDKVTLAEADAAEAAGDLKGAQRLRRLIGD